jgi:hypothetical protein
LYSISTVADDDIRTFVKVERQLGENYQSKEGKLCHRSGGFLLVFAALAGVQ